MSASASRGLRLARGAAIALVALVALLWLAWTFLTLWYANLQPVGLRQAIAFAYAAWLVAAALFLRPRRRGLAAVAASGVLVSAAYLAQWPSNDRQWQPDVAVAATATIEGERVTIHGVRNFRYRSETDFDEVWEERSYDLGTLRTLDLFMSYWGPTDYCHTILSFGFEGGECLAVSVEVRKEVGETYSTFGGFFRMFELCYVFADERDVIGLRTIHRGEDVYLYRLRAGRERLREVFLSYLHFANKLAERPQFYDVLENSCGVNILHRIAESGDVPWTFEQGLLNGHWDKLLYERGAIDRSTPLEQLRRTSHINARAQEAGGAEDFSARIRIELPAAPTPLAGRAEADDSPD